MNKLKKMNGRERTFLLITIPILALFFCFNTLPLIKGVIYSFTNFRGYGEFDWVGLRNMQIYLLMQESENPTCLHSSLQLLQQLL